MSYSINLSLADSEVIAGGGSVVATITGQAVSVPPVVTPPPVVVPPVSGVAPKLATVFSQNGHANPAWTQDYSYSGKATVTQPGNGNTACISFTTDNPWGGYQPSNTNGASTVVSGTTLTVDISAAKGKQFSMQFLMQGDVAIGTSKQFVKTVDGWERFTVPKATLMTYQGKDVSGIIYKGAVQSQQGTANDTFQIDNWGSV